LRDIDQMRHQGKWNVGENADGKPSQGHYVCTFYCMSIQAESRMPGPFISSTKMLRSYL
jgi:hypothetical protein